LHFCLSSSRVISRIAEEFDDHFPVFGRLRNEIAQFQGDLARVLVRHSLGTLVVIKIIVTGVGCGSIVDENDKGNECQDAIERVHDAGLRIFVQSSNPESLKRLEGV
jgi:hypothetical protein